MHDRVIGSYAFENKKGVTEIVNRERYRNLLDTFLAPVAEQMNILNELWF